MEMRSRYLPISLPSYPELAVKLWLASSLALFYLGCSSEALGQIAPDGTLSTNVTTADNLNFTINDGNRAGNNLFHSFREFSVPTGGEAFFNNAADIQNIFSRVTGNSISNIDGLIRANAQANLFLINPNGIIFGQNARLNIGGSFLGSVASNIKFSDGIEFSATNPQSSALLSINVPIGLQINSNPGTILNQSLVTDNNGQLVGLQVQSGKSLILVGGDVNLQGGGLNAFGGYIELGGLANAGTIGLTLNGNTLNLSFPPDTIRANVSLTDDARVSVRGVGGGDIVVNANNFTATNGGRLVAGTQGAGNGGNITVNANTFSISGAGILSQTASGLSSQVLPEASGNGGNIFVNTRSFSATSGAAILAQTFGIGNAGNVKIVSPDSVELTDSPIETVAYDGSSGDAGNIFITTGTFTASGKNGYLWSGTYNGGRNSGNITLTADSVTLLNGSTIDSSNRFGSGNAGTVEINAKNDISISGDGYISTSSAGQGNGGNVTVRAGGSVSLANGDIDTSALLGSNGRGGDISIIAKSLLMTDGTDLGAFATQESQAAGDITVQTTDFVTLDNDSKISAFSGSTGYGGNISIATARLNVLNGSTIFAPVSSDKSGGNLTINAKESVELGGVSSKNGLVPSSNISIDTLGSGNAGNLTINTQRLIIRDGADIRTSSLSENSGNGGNLIVNASESVEVIGTTQDGLTGSSISTDSGGNGAAGNIRITTGRLIVRDGGRVSAFTLGSGKGGTLDVNASDSVEVIGTRPDGVFASYLSTESSGTGAAGNISITTGRLIVRDGGNVTASTSREGEGGTLIVNASDSVEVIGKGRGGLGSNLTTQTFGEKNAGDIEINTGRLIVQDGAEVTVSSAGYATGNAGNLDVQADSIRLENRAAIIGQSGAGGNGANISLRSQNLLLLRYNSAISTTAGTQKTGGNGGNISIDTANLVALENSDITANAFQGQGGQISITTQGIFGTQARTREELQTLLGTGNLDPRLLLSNDISAISQQGGPQLQGTVAINTPDVDPSSGLLPLAANLVDATRLVASVCRPKGGEQNRFIVTGRGGLPPNPIDGIPDKATWFDVRPRLVSPDQMGELPTTNSQLIITNSQIREAQGWITNSQGEVVLTAQASIAIPANSGLAQPECYAP